MFLFGRVWRDLRPILSQESTDIPMKPLKFWNPGCTRTFSKSCANGIYLQITRPVTLADGMRFRIGDYVLEYRDADQ